MLKIGWIGRGQPSVDLVAAPRVGKPAKQRVPKEILRQAKLQAAAGVFPQSGAVDAVRLNVGCGDKILRGFINVDIAPTRKGNEPNVLSDIRRLGFRDDCVDEVLSVHVIEHVYQWEAGPLLEEWMRILKPDGRIVVECPNLLHAAQELLGAPETRTRPDKDGQLSMWVLYGDPSWRDPLMAHRWGYTPYSLRLLLEAVGFIDVRQEPARFKKKDPRDMRVTGRKPNKSEGARAASPPA